MMVSTKGRYALFVLIDLAKHQGDGFVSLSEVAERQKLSLKYLESVVSMLNKGGLLKSCRGKNGGYRLSKEPAEYNINEILQLTEGSLAPVDCIKNNEAGCANSEGCMTLPLWVGMDRLIAKYLKNITLQDLIDGNREKMLDV
jgi:Rrf2 family protein